MKSFSDAKTVIDLYNESVKDNSLTQEHWNDILSICDDSLSDYLTKIKGQEATLTGYNTSLQGNITGFRKVYKAIGEYNKLSGSNSKKQKEYCDAISLTNSKLGSYLTNLNGSKAGMLGYASSLVGATLKTVALQVATTALNAAITMGASLIVGGIITAISNWIRQDEILAEKAETAKQKIDELNNNYKEHSQLVSDSAKRYAELAQGVDQLSGKNLSLNDDDYKEFLDLSNQLAEAFPTLSRHYDENGNAILQLSGNVDTIVGSLNNLIEAERALKNQEIADELPTVYKNANNKSDDYKKQIDELKEQRQTLIDSLGDVQSDDFSKNFIDGLEKSMISVEGENLETLSKMKDDYLKILKDANIDYEELTPDYENKDGVDIPVRFNIKINSSEEDIKKAKKTIKANVENLASEYEGDISELNDKIQSVQDKNKANWSSLTGSIAAWLDTEDSYKIMSDDMQSTIQNIVNSLDWGELDFSSWEDAKQYIQDNILSLFQTSDGKDILKKIEVMFGIQTQFNNGEITVNEYQEKLRTFLDEISTLAPDTQKAIKLIFGISTDEDGITTSSVDTMVNNVKSKLKDEFDDKVGELSLDDLQVASKLEIPEGTLLSWDELKQKIEEIKNATSEETPISPTSFEDAWTALDSTDDDAIKTLKKDLLEAAEAGQLSSEKFNELDETEYFKNLGISADSAIEKINSLVNASTQLSSMSAQISKMSDMLADKKNGTVASASDLAGFDVSVRGLESWDKFEEVMGSSESSMEQCQKAANDLATEWVNDGNFLSNLTDENKQYYITQLDQMGVENASTVVEEALANKRAEEAAQTEYNTTATEYNTKAKTENEKVTTDLTDATPKEVAEILAEASASKAAKKSIAELYLSKLDINNTKINTKDDVNNIVAIAKAAGVSKQYISQLQSALDKLVNGNTYSNGTKFSDLQFGMTSGKIDYSSGLPTIDELKKKGTQQQAKKSAEDIVKQINDSFTEIKMPDIKIKPTGSSSYKSPSSKKSKSKTKSDAAEVFDFIEIKLNNLTDKASKAKDKIDDLLTFGQKKNQTKKAIEATTKAITAQEKAYKKYMAYANKAAKTQNSKKTSSSSSTSTGGDALYDTATDYLGLKYVWGGASLTKGADCSGFTQQIYKKFGVSLPHKASYQAKMGTKITSKSDLQAGDLVFFGSKNNITHVGIYGGDGKFIESPHTGASVRVSKLSSRKDFVSGSRFSGISGSTKTSGKNVKKVKGVSSKTLEHYKRLIREGTLGSDGIASIKNENLKNALKDYQTYYEKAKACKEQVASLTDQLKDLYETLANNPIDNASDKIEKLGTKMDILNAKVGNLTFNPTKKIGTSDIDSLYKQIIKNYNSQLSASKTAYTGATKSYNSNKSSLTKSLKKTKAKNIGLTQKEFNSIKSNLKSNKSISYNLINKIENDTLREKCIAHNEYLLAKNTATDNYNQAKEDHTSNVRQARKDRFDKVQERYDNKAGLIEQKKNAVSNSLSIAEAKGQLIGEAYYTRQANAVKSDMKLKQEEAGKLAKKLSTIKFGSDEWYEAQEALNGVYESIQQDEQELAEFQKSINELKFDRFDELLNKLGDITDETDFLIDMLDSDNLFDSDTGMITDDGITAIGLTAQNYDTYLAEAQKYKDAIADLNEMYNDGNGTIGYNDYISKLREYQQGMRNSIKSANDAKKSLVAYVKQGLDAQNDALEEAISKKKELLETDKSLKEWNDKLADSNKNIAKLEKQIAALEGDDSEENRKKLQQLKSDLQDAQKDQSDMLYDHSVSDQEDALDKMLENSKKQAEDYLKDTDKVFSDALTYVNANSSQVASNIEKIAKDTGYDVSTYIVNAWKDGGSAVGDYASTLSSNVPNITAQLSLIESSWDRVCKAADKAAEASAKYAGTNVNKTQSIGLPNDSGNSGSNNADKQQELNKLRKKASDITEWISKHSVSATHKKSYYGTLNQYLYDKQHGQVLSKDNEVALAKKLGVSVKSDLSGKNDRKKIASALKKLIKDASFSTGGVIKDLVKLSGEDGISFLQRGEAVLSKEQTQALLNFKPVIPQIDSIIGNLKNIPIEKVSLQSPTYQIDNRTIVEGVATDQIVKQMEGVAQKQAENVVRKINQATYAKGVRR